MALTQRRFKNNNAMTAAWYNSVSLENIVAFSQTDQGNKTCPWPCWC